MKRLAKFGFKLVLLVGLLVSFGFHKQEKLELNMAFQQKDYFISNDPNWMRFNNGLKIPITDFFEKTKSSLGLPDNFGIQIEKSDTDDLGMVHYLLRLTSNKIVINDAWYTAHYSNKGDLLEFEGTFRSKIPTITRPKVTKNDAILISKNVFSNRHEVFSEEFKIIKLDLDSATESNGNIEIGLVYYKTEQQEYKLTYKVIVTSSVSEPMLEVYVDSQTGNVLKSQEIVFNAVNDVVTKYNGIRTFQTTWSGNYYYLKDLSKLTPIETKNSSYQASYPYCVPYNFVNLATVSNGSSTTWGYDAYNNAPSAHWAIQESYNVLKDHFSRYYGTFYQAGCGEIRVENNYYFRRELPNGPDKFLNTHYAPSGSNDYFHFGNIYGIEGNDVGLDVAGHEFTHGCLYRSRSIGVLEGTEAGALVESFGDIFGEVIEYYTLGSNDYVFGTNDLPRYRRDFVHPESDSIFSNTFSNSCSPIINTENFISLAPSIWHGDNWYYNQNEAFNYINCSVQDHWFYLLAEGDTQNGVTVTGIGIEKAAAITYRNLAYYVTNSSTFTSMRNASISNAEALYGRCSLEYLQVRNAWAAVGVGSPAGLCASILGPSSLYSNESGIWEAVANNGSGNYTYRWYVDGNYYSNATSIWTVFHDEDWSYHTIGLTVRDGIGLDSLGISVLVSPEHKLVAYISGSSWLNSGEQGYWEGIGIGGDPQDYTYSWSVDDSYYSSDASITDSFYEEEITDHKIELTISSGYQNADADLFYVRVYPDQKKMFSISDQITVNIYPNPAASSTTIKITDKESPAVTKNGYEVRIIDIYGKVLFMKKLMDTELNVNTSHFKSGTYTIIVSAGGKKGTSQLTIRK